MPFRKGQAFICGPGPFMDACVAARPAMIATLNSFRDTLEDLGNGLGVTDAAAGAVVLAAK